MMKTTSTKFKLFVGGHGAGKTKRARQILGSRPYTVMEACNITIDDIYSYPRTHGILIEEVNYKPETKKIINILTVHKNVVLTSINEKDVPKSIMNMCVRKRMGQTDNRQELIKQDAPNSNKPLKFDKSVYDLNIEYLKNKDRHEVLKYMKYNSPPDMQMLSWVAPNIDVRKIAFADQIMRRWNADYFMEIFVFSWSGNHHGRVNFPQRNSYSPVPKICHKLGLKEKDAYLVKSYLKNPEWKEWAISKLDADECKTLGLSKPRKQPIRYTNTKLGDF